jgi:hypothetical protein
LGKGTGCQTAQFIRVRSDDVGQSRTVAGKYLLEKAAIPQFSPSNRTGESDLLNSAGMLCGFFL